MIEVTDVREVTNVKLYTIKPLEWWKVIDTDQHEVWHAYVPDWTYIIDRHNHTYTWRTNRRDNRNAAPCNSIEDGKRQAEDDWHKTISAALEPWRHETQT